MTISNSCYSNESSSDVHSLSTALYLTLAATITISFTFASVFIYRNSVTKFNASSSTESKDETVISDNQSCGIGVQHPSYQEYNGCIYLDYNATTPIFPEVTNAITPYISNRYGNPSSLHVYGKPCRDSVKEARKNIAKLINVTNIESILFTSCGTESDNRAIDIAIHHNKKKYDMINIKPHVIASKIEHPAVLCYLRLLEFRQLIDFTLIGVNEEGFVLLDDLQQALTEVTVLISIMHSNNEVGTIQNMKEISKIIAKYNSCHNHEILLHSDCAQSFGKVQVDVNMLSIDLVTIVGHKFGAPKGIAALYIREGIEIPILLSGGGQEFGKRSGTENVALIVGLGKASQIAFEESDRLLIHMLNMKKLFIETILNDYKVAFPKNSIEQSIKFNGPKKCYDSQHLLLAINMLSSIMKLTSNNNSNHTHPIATDNIIHQLPNTISISFKNIQAHELLGKLHDRVACSAGSACHSQDVGVQLSYVLEAMNVPPEFGLGTLRITLGRHSTRDEILRASKDIIHALKSIL